MDLGGGVKSSAKAPSMNVFKKRNELIPFEEFEVGKYYAITLNPCDKYQHVTSGNRIGTALQELFTKIIVHLDLYYELWMEVSPKGRIHYHGYCKAEKENKKILFYICGLPRLLTVSTVVLKELSDDFSWKRYVTKQWQLHQYIHQMHYTKMPLRRPVPLVDEFFETDSDTTEPEVNRIPIDSPGPL